MATNQVSIYNMAIGMVGGKRIMSLVDDEPNDELGTEGSLECALLNELWTTCVDDVVAGRDWSFARAIRLLTSVTDPLASDGLDRPCFALPGDYAAIRQIDDNPDFDSNPGYDWEIQDGVIVIPGGAPGAMWCRYTRITRDPAKFDGPFTSCLVARLASELALPIAHSRPMFEMLTKLYAARLQLSTTSNSLQGRRTPLKTGKLIQSRGK